MQKVTMLVVLKSSIPRSGTSMTPVYIPSRTTEGQVNNQTTVQKRRLNYNKESISIAIFNNLGYNRKTSKILVFLKIIF